VKMIIDLFSNSALCTMLVSIDTDLRMLTLESQSPFLLTILKNQGESCRHPSAGTDLLYFECDGVLKNKRILKDCIAMCAELIDQLARIGAADR
jgi:hypothetical protein